MLKKVLIIGAALVLTLGIMSGCGEIEENEFEENSVPAEVQEL